MKRQTITLLSLTGALVLCAGGYAVLAFTPQEEEAPAVALTSAADELTAASWQIAGTTISFVKTDDTWHLEGQEAFPVDGEKVLTALTALTPLEAQPLSEQAEDSAAYGITDDSDRVALTTADGETVIRFGDDNPLGTGRYCAPEESGSIYLADTTALDALTTDAMDFIEMEEVPDMTDTVRWSIESGQAAVQVLSRQQDEGSLDGFAWENAAGEPLDTSSVESTLAYLTGLSYLRCAAYAPQDLAEYGLEIPQATVRVTYRDAQGQEAEMAWQLGLQTDDGFYARPEGSDDVYVIDAALGQEVLDGAAADFSAKQPFNLAWDNAASVLLETQDTKTEMEIVREISDESESNSTSSIEVSYTVDGEAADAAKAAQWLNDWNALTVTGQAESFDGETWFTMTVTPLDGEPVVLEWAKTEEAAAVRQGDGVWKIVDMNAVQTLLEFWNASEQTTSESTS